MKRSLPGQVRRELEIVERAGERERERESGRERAGERAGERDERGVYYWLNRRKLYYSQY